MKFFASIFVYVAVGLVLAWGIALTLKGNFWLLGVGVLAYLVAFTKIGCLPPSKDH